jgi:hypothetical protein
MHDLVLIDDKIQLQPKVVEVPPTIHDIFALQYAMLALPKEQQVDSNKWLKHTFSEGTYARELSMPKGMLVIGKIHRHSHINIISRGKCIVYTTEGKQIIDATNHPVTFSSSPGTKRVGYMLEDTIWTTIHLTNSTDIDEIEKEVIISEEEFFSNPLNYSQQLNIECIKNDISVNYKGTK